MFDPLSWVPFELPRSVIETSSPLSLMTA